MDLQERLKLGKPTISRHVLNAGCWKKPQRVYEEWLKKPMDPEKLLQEESWLQWGRRTSESIPIGENINLARIANEIDKQKKGPNAPGDLEFTWQHLTRFNWGTDDPAEVNYYLWLFLGPCLKRTHDRNNYGFISDPLKKPEMVSEGVVHPLQFLWVPEYQEPSPPEKKTGTKKTPILFDTSGCAYRSPSEKCAKMEMPKGQKVNCPADVFNESGFSPTTRDSNARIVIIGETPEETLNRVVEKIDFIEFSVNRFQIHRTAIPPEKETQEPPGLLKSFETLTELHILDVAHDSQTGNAKNGKIKARPHKEESSYKQLPDHKLRTRVGAEDLAHVAKTIRDLHSMNLLDRVIIRAYEDRQVDRDWKDRENRTQTRADWVLEALKNEFFLPLFDETVEVAEELLKRGAISVQVIGCGAGDAPRRVKDVSYRVAIVTCETSEKPKPKETYEEIKNQRWAFYECSIDPGEFEQDQKELIELAKAQGPNDEPINVEMELNAIIETRKKKPRTLFYSLQSDELAFDDITANKFRNEVRPFLLLWDALLKVKKDDLDEVRKEIRRWDCLDSETLVDSFSSNENAKLSHNFWQGFVKGKSFLNFKPNDQNNDRTAPWKNKVWENMDLSAPANHCRFLYESTIFSCSADSMRQIETMAGTEYKKTERVRFQ